MSYQLINPDGSVAWEYPTELEANYVASLLMDLSGRRFTVRETETYENQTQAQPE